MDPGRNPSVVLRAGVGGQTWLLPSDNGGSSFVSAPRVRIAPFTGESWRREAANRSTFPTVWASLILLLCCLFATSSLPVF